MTARLGLILALLVFLVTFLVRAPAGLATAFLPHDIACEQPTGTVWNGRCSQLRSGELVLQELHWTLHPAALLRLSVSADLMSADPRLTGRMQAELRPGGTLELRAVQARAQLPLPATLVALPRGISGSVQLALDQARLEHGKLSQLQGRVQLRQLHLASPSLDLGSYEAVFAPQAPGEAMVGQLRDLSGPLSLAGELRLNGDGHYEVSGTLAPRTDAADALRQALQLIGPADAGGRRMFSLSGVWQ